MPQDLRLQLSKLVESTYRAQKEAIELTEQNALFYTTACFFASVIKSGETWTQTCQDKFDLITKAHER